MEMVEVDVRRPQQSVAGQALGVLKDTLCDGLGRRAAVADVVLDAEVGIGTSGVVTGGEDKSAHRVTPANHGGHGGR